MSGNNVQSSNVKEESGQVELDQTSTERKFSWHLVSRDICLPQILRTQPDGSTLGYVSVKMAEKSLLKTFLESLPSEVMMIPRVLGHPVTANERRLLFEINRVHCDSQFGDMEKFSKDRLINSQEFSHYFAFLSISQARLDSKISQVDSRFGFLRINLDIYYC